MGKDPIRLQYPDLRTNNEAEMQTAIEALLYAYKSIELPKQANVVLYGDSQIAVFCLSGKWKARKPHLKPFVSTFQQIAGRFGSVKLQWQPRAKSVAILGH